MLQILIPNSGQLTLPSNQLPILGYLWLCQPSTILSFLCNFSNSIAASTYRLACLLFPCPTSHFSTTSFIPQHSYFNYYNRKPHCPRRVDIFFYVTGLVNNIASTFGRKNTKIIITKCCLATFEYMYVYINYWYINHPPVELTTLHSWTIILIELLTFKTSEKVLTHIWVSLNM